MEKRCIIIPAIKKNAVIPDQLVKKLAGVTLIERAIETARAVAQGKEPPLHIQPISLAQYAPRMAAPLSASVSACSSGATAS